MQIRSFTIAYALVLAILLFADRRPGSTQQDHYSHVLDLTDGQTAGASHARASESGTRIIAPDTLIPGTWTAGQIPAERLVAPLVVIDLKTDLNADSNPTREGSPQLSLDDIAAWESQHGMIPQGAIVAIRQTGNDGGGTGVSSVQPGKCAQRYSANISAAPPLPITHDAAMFLIEARNTVGFAADAPLNITSDRTLAQQIALHGNYVIEGARFNAVPATGSLIIVAPARNATRGEAPVRILAMLR